MILGVTGKIASGKSEILKILGRKGFYCIDADKIVHDLYDVKKAGAKVVEEVFGEKVLTKDGHVDRKKLRDLVFSDENKLKLLENIIHPLVYEDIANILKRVGDRNVAIEAAYFDNGFLGDFIDKILWVESPIKEIKKQLIENRGFSEEIAENVIAFIEKPRKVDFELKNDGSLVDLEKKIEELF